MLKKMEAYTTLIQAENQKSFSKTHTKFHFLGKSRLIILTYLACRDIKVIDFGSATYEYENRTGIINTRQYRGPEVMLGNQQWDYKSDMWSLG